MPLNHLGWLCSLRCSLPRTTVAPHKDVAGSSCVQPRGPRASLTLSKKENSCSVPYLPTAATDRSLVPRSFIFFCREKPRLNGVPTTRTKHAWNPGSTGPCFGHPGYIWLRSIRGLAAPSLALCEVGPLTQDLREGKPTATPYQICGSNLVLRTLGRLWRTRSGPPAHEVMVQAPQEPGKTCGSAWFDSCWGNQPRVSSHAVKFLRLELRPHWGWAGA